MKVMRAWYQKKVLIKKNEYCGDEHCLRFNAIGHRSYTNRSLFAAEENETDI